MPWYVLYTKAKQEKKVADGLKQIGIEAYCPMATVVKQWSDRKKKVEVPLLNSYVFVSIAERQRDSVFAVPGIVRYLFWLGKPAVVRDNEIFALQKSLEGVVTSFEVIPLQKKELIVIASGPFQGLEGIVTQINKSTIQVALQELGFLVSIKRDA